MLPDNTASSLTVAAGKGIYLAPDDQVVRSTIDFERGGTALLDASQGLLVKTWRCWVEDKQVKLQANGGPVVVLFEESGVTDVALAFDQNMRWSVAYLRYGVLTLRWYDPLVSDHVVSTFGPGRCPRMALDDKRATGLSQSDIIFAYLRGNTLYYRQQRDRYLIERTLRENLYPGTRLRNIGMNKNLRMQFELVE